jgi:hypothetical protein
MSDNVGDLVESAVILFVKGMENPPLNRLEPIFQLGDSPIPDYVGSVLNKIFVDQILQWIFGQV